MATQVEICNDALTHLGASTISALDDNTKQAQRLSLVWAAARDRLLAKHRWGFARKQVALAVVSGVEIDGWDYVYAMPSDCLDAREIYKSTVDLPPILFTQALSTDRTTRYILTNEEDAQLVYTARIETATLYPPPFAAALAWELADRIAMPLTADLNLKDYANKQARIAFIEAANADANQQVSDPARTADWIADRA